jgi:hypothetical protein
VGGQFDPALLALIPAEYLDAFFAAIRAGIADAIGSIFWLAVVASLVALVAATLIEEIPLRGKPSEGVVAEL